MDEVTKSVAKRVRSSNELLIARNTREIAVKQAEIAKLQMEIAGMTVENEKLAADIPEPTIQEELEPKL